jgi:hypothetical protein
VCVFDFKVIRVSIQTRINMESTKSAEQQKRAPITDFGWGPSDHADADLQIISTDNVVFWFSSTVLARHS